MRNETNNDGRDIMEMFGLTYEQSRLMFSVQKYIANYDASISKKEEKHSWVQEWEKGIQIDLQNINPEITSELCANEAALAKEFRVELEKSRHNLTWYYIVILESLAFTPYYALNGDNDKKYNKLKYNKKKCLEKLYGFFAAQGYVTEEKIDRLNKCFQKSINQISGKTYKVAAKVVGVVAIAGVTAALAAVAAGPIAVALFGGEFELSGAALTSACLAMAGGGSIAAGGAGMAGGVAVIAGGGALIGAAGGGAAIGVTSVLLSSSPGYVLSQAAKLETILKEVILNAQQDVVTAQKIIQQYREQIEKYRKVVSELELERKLNKEEFKKLKLGFQYMKKAYQEMSRFSSSYEIGKEVQGNGTE